MNLLKKLKIGIQLSLGFGTMTGLIAVLAIFSVLRVTGLANAYSAAGVITSEKLEPLYAMREALAQTGLAARNAYIFTDELQAAKELALVDDEKAIYLSTLEKMAKAYHGDPQFATVREGLLQMATELKRPRLYREAGKMEEYGLFLVNECSPLRRRIVQDIAVLVGNAQKEAFLATRTAENSARDAKQLVALMAFLAFMLSICIAYFIRHLLLRQLGGEPVYAAEIAHRIAHGDLAIDVKLPPRDERSLMFAIKVMRDSLAGIVGEVRHGTEAITRASNEIVSGNVELSRRTEGQTQSLARVAIAMHHLTATVKQNADSALEANDLAQSASGISEEGGMVMRQVDDTMESITASSKKIVEIISVIDAIAFQTNILALNAAVEAARAGDQGRGFAVVASEVRVLAQRSAIAAKEIKALIDDAVSKVVNGSLLVGKACTTIQAVVVSVRQVTEIMADISCASREQSAGIQQVSRALVEMDAVTEKNAALVEEASAAAVELKEQASHLSEVVGQFKLEQPMVAPRIFRSDAATVQVLGFKP